MAPRPNRVLGNLLFDRVARERAEHGPVARQNTERRTDAGAPQDRQSRLLHVVPVWKEPPDGLSDHVAALRVLEVAQDLGDAEETHGKHGEVDSVRQELHAHRHALLARLEVGADRREQDPEDDHGDRLQDRPARKDDREDEAHHHESEVLGRSEHKG
jgi:hypothetical protein